MNIQEIGQKGKQALSALLKPDTFVILLVILTGAGAFELGRLSALNEAPQAHVQHPVAAVVVSQIQIKPEVSAVAGVTAGIGNYVASSGGTKYYPLSCSGVSRISEANKVWFATKQEAEAAGYTPAASCKF